jgi:hypothetical protein
MAVALMPLLVTIAVSQPLRSPRLPETRPDGVFRRDNYYRAFPFDFSCYIGRMTTNFDRRQKQLFWKAGAIAGAMLIVTSLAWTVAELKWIHDRHAFMASELASPDSAEGWPSAYHTKAPGALGLFGESGMKVLYVAIPRSRLREGCDGSFFIVANDPKVLQARRLFPEAEIRTYWWNSSDSRTESVLIED